jgi:hypothetical protein
MRIGKEAALILILSTKSSNSESNGNADYAMVSITPELAQCMVERIEHLSELQQRDSSLYKMVYSDSTPTFFSWYADLIKIEDLGLDAAEAVIDSDGYAMLDTDYTVPEDYCIDMEDQCMVVYGDHITWEAYVKNTSTLIITYTVSVELLRGLAIPVD